MKSSHSRSRIGGLERIGARWLLAATLATPVALTPSRARGAEAPATADESAAKELMKKGFASAKKKDWEQARVAFAAAWAKRQHFAIALSLAEVEVKLGRRVEACEHFQFVVENIPDDLADKRKQAEQQLDECKAQVGTVTVQVKPRGATLTVDGHRIGEAPITRELYFEPGDHYLYAEHSGRRSPSRHFHLSQGSKLHLDVSAEPVTAAPVEAASAPAGSALTASLAPDAARDSNEQASLRVPVVIGGVALTVAAATVGTVFVLKGNAASSDAEAAFADATSQRDPSGDPDSVCTGATRPVACDTALGHVDDKQRFRTVATGAFITSGVVALGTVATYLLWPEPDRRSKRERAMLTPVFDGKTAGALLRATF